ncbi:MAG: DUF3576 domain-containing protein [Bdellovibrionales bacterium]
MNNRRFPKTWLSYFCLALLALGLGACQSLGLESDPSYTDQEKEELYKNGSLLSDKGGVDILNLGGEDKNAGGAGLGVNGYLWRASLDTISFMPISSADPFGGVIITDWYSPPDNANERMRLNVFIRDRYLRADGVKVSAFRQVRASGGWTQAPVTAATESSLENAILTKARQLRLAQKDVK